MKPSSDIGYLSVDDAVALRTGVREGIRLDLPDGVQKVLRYNILFRWVLTAGVMKIDDIKYGRRRWRNNEEFVSEYLDFLDRCLACWLNKNAGFAMYYFLKKEINDGGFLRSNAFPILLRMALEIKEIYPAGELPDEESVKTRQVVKRALRIKSI